MNTKDLRVGQLWRNKINGKVIRITQVDRMHPSPPNVDVYWDSVTGAGKRTGLRSSRGWAAAFELVD